MFRTVGVQEHECRWQGRVVYWFEARVNPLRQYFRLLRIKWWLYMISEDQRGAFYVCGRSFLLWIILNIWSKSLTKFKQRSISFDPGCIFLHLRDNTFLTFNWKDWQLVNCEDKSYQSFIRCVGFKRPYYSISPNSQEDCSAHSKRLLWLTIS
jgi:hypothetical protein